MSDTWKSWGPGHVREHHLRPRHIGLVFPWFTLQYVYVYIYINNNNTIIYIYLVFIYLFIYAFVYLFIICLFTYISIYMCIYIYIYIEFLSLRNPNDSRISPAILRMFKMSRLTFGLYYGGFTCLLILEHWEGRIVWTQDEMRTQPAVWLLG